LKINDGDDTDLTTLLSQANLNQNEEQIEGLSRYKSVKLAPSFLKEVFSHYKRRLVEFISTSKEFIRLLGPLLITCNFMVLMEFILSVIFK